VRERAGVADARPERGGVETMRRIMAAALCVAMLLEAGCAIVSSERTRKDEHEEYTFSICGIPLYHTKNPVEPAPSR